MDDIIITSAQNPKIKKLIQLQLKSTERRKEDLFVVEGQRELMHSIEAGYEVDTLFYCDNLIKDYSEIGDIIASTKSFAVSADFIHS